MGDDHHGVILLQFGISSSIRPVEMGSSAEHGSSTAALPGEWRYHAQYTDAVADTRERVTALVQFIFGFVPQCGLVNAHCTRSSMSARESFSNNERQRRCCRRWTSGTASVSGHHAHFRTQQGDILRVGQDVVPSSRISPSARCSGYSSNIL